MGTAINKGMSCQFVQEEWQHPLPLPLPLSLACCSVSAGAPDQNIVFTDIFWSISSLEITSITAECGEKCALLHLPPKSEVRVLLRCGELVLESAFWPLLQCKTSLLQLQDEDFTIKIKCELICKPHGVSVHKVQSMIVNMVQSWPPQTVCELIDIKLKQG